MAILYCYECSVKGPSPPQAMIWVDERSGSGDEELKILLELGWPQFFEALVGVLAGAAVASCENSCKRRFREVSLGDCEGAVNVFCSF